MLRSLLIPILAAALALLIGALLIASVGISPGLAYAKLFQGAFGIDPQWTLGQPISGLIRSPGRLGNSLTEAIPLILAGLAVALPFRCGLLNIGGEGQIYMGALGATLAGLYIPGLPTVIHLPLALLAAFLFGAVWAMIPAALRAYRGLNEIITCIMLNFIAFWIVSYLVHGPMQDPASTGYSWSPPVPESAQLPLMLDRMRVNLGFFVAIAAAIILALILWRTVIGYQMRAIGANLSAARHAGIPAEHGIMLSMALAGGMAGLAGACVILGVQLRLSDFFSPGYGYDGIAVMLVGQAQPIGVIFSGLFFGALRTGAEAMELSVGVPQSVADIIQALTLLFVIISQSAAIVRWIAKQRTAQRARILARNAGSDLPVG